MKLSSHQKKIIEKIIKGEVFDIPSYLRSFGKGCERQYDTEEIKKIFEHLEDGYSYCYRADEGIYFTDVYDKNGEVISSIPVPNKMTYVSRENPLTVPVKADIKMKISPETVNYAGKSYSFNFLENSYFVANQFEDIVDFIALWSYLSKEALIIEVNKPVEDKDLSIFFEQERQQIKKDESPYWDWKIMHYEKEQKDKLEIGSSSFVPYKFAENYIEKVWRLNKEHLIMCKDFIGKKIIATSMLQLYQKNKYRTFEETSQRRNLIVAWVAVFISIISIIAGNIIPLFDKQVSKQEKCLDKLECQVSAIESEVTSTEVEENILKELRKILSVIENVRQDRDETNEALQTEMEKLDLLFRRNLSYINENECSDRYCYEKWSDR